MLDYMLDYYAFSVIRGLYIVLKVDYFLLFCHSWIVVITPSVVLHGYPPGQGTPLDRVPPRQGTPLDRVPPRTGYPPGQGTPRTGYPPRQGTPPDRVPPLARVPPQVDLAGYPPQLPHGILGNVAKALWDMGTPPCGQTDGWMDGWMDRHWVKSLLN